MGENFKMITILGMNSGRGVLTALLGFVMLGCTATAVERKQGSLLQQIAADPAKLENRIVEVTGKFSGWKGGCKGAPPVSRSDWMLEDGDSCIYVNGRLPSGFSSLPPGSGFGKKLAVKGLLRTDSAGRAYIEDATAEPL